MSNWFKQSQSMNDTHDRYPCSVEAYVWVPKGGQPDIALNILQTMINKIEGDTSLETGVDANIQVGNIKFI